MSRAGIGSDTGVRRGSIWALLGTRLGDNRTIESLTEATGLPSRTIALRFNAAGALPNLRRGGSLFSLSRDSRALIAGPWPDVVITSGKRAVPAALWIKAASVGRTRLVHLGRPQAPLSWFDLVITTPHYGLPPRPNVWVQRFPPTLARPAAEIEIDLAALPRPRVLAIAGGDAGSLALDAGAAAALAREALDRAAAAGGSLLVATSPRTSKPAVAALRACLSRAQVPVRLSVFGEGRNDYRAFLTAADAILVTDDSVSMVTEAAMTGAPVALFALPERPAAALRVARALFAGIDGRAEGRLRDALVSAGLARSTRRAAGFMAELAADGLLDGGDAARKHAARELQDAARRVRDMATAD